MGFCRRRSREEGLGTTGYYLTPKKRRDFSGKGKGGEMFARQCVEVLLRKNIQSNKYISTTLE